MFGETPYNVHNVQYIFTKNISQTEKLYKCHSLKKWYTDRSQKLNKVASLLQVLHIQFYTFGQFTVASYPNAHVFGQST